ncbi:type IV secretion protein DotH [Marinobacter halodurans]|uniref:Type IV secretion protein DotH n=1 Tax=Marinobacter halodurans TaxID=2528979 RepID=A0ABY1ZMG3_9GAMM|nr:DotH/IcmK family type IV secretion protein [Marinobacter halodurans]TBW57354.1 type IV secretion protein DotH [Marinobacter halodurans]
MTSIRTMALFTLCLSLAAPSATYAAGDGANQPGGIPKAVANNQSQGDEQSDLAELPEDLKPAFWLKPHEVVQTRERQLQEQNATYRPLRDVKAIQDISRIRPSSSRIPVINVVPDYPSSVVFTDMTGKSWPIRYLAQTASVATVKKVEGSDNALVFYAKNHAGEKSVSVYLKNLSMPITLRVKATEDKYHALKRIQILERGPNSQALQLASNTGGRPRFQAQAEQGRSPQEQEGPSLDAILNKLAYRVTPDGFKKIQVSDPETEAWIDEGDASKLYLLTARTISSPAPISGADSVVPVGDGMRIYVLPRINPVMALNESGQRLYLTLKE